MNLDDVKGMMESMGWRVISPEPQEQKFKKWIKTIPGADDSIDATIKSIEAGIEQVEKNLDDIDKRFNRFMTAHDPSYPRQKIKGNFPQHYPKAKSTPPKKKVDPMFQEREKSDAGKLADKFNELLKKK